MSFDLPPSEQGSISPHSQLSPQKKRKREEEEKPDTVAQKRLKPSELEEGQNVKKKFKKDIQRRPPSEKEVTGATDTIGKQAIQGSSQEKYQDEDIEMTSSETVSRKRKAEQGEEARKKRKIGLSADEELIESLSQKKNTTDPEIIIDSLKTLCEKGFHSTENPEVTSLLISFLENFRGQCNQNQCNQDQCNRLNDLLILMYPRAKDSLVKENIKQLVGSFTVLGQCHDLSKNLTFLQESTSENPQKIINNLLAGPYNKLTLNQKIQALSFAHDNGLHIGDSHWHSVVIPEHLIDGSNYLQSQIQAIPQGERAALIRDILHLLYEPMYKFNILIYSVTSIFSVSKISSCR